MTDKTSTKEYSVAVIGGGITGASLLYYLSRYTSIDNMLLLEKNKELALVSSFVDNNSQTLHFGDIETNYSLEKAIKVKEASEMVVRYLQAHPDEKLYTKSYKMVLAVGDAEVDVLDKRFDEFKETFPKLRRIEKDEIGKLEPLIVQKRGEKEKLLALYSEDGYAVDYQALSKSFVEQARKTSKNIDVFFNTQVSKILPQAGYYEIVTKDNKTLRAKYVVFAAGGYSLVFARQLGYGLEYGILPVSGSFYVGRNLLRGKVYTMQEKKLPFAAVHGDPSVRDPQETRFGPTAKVLPMLERYNYSSVPDFFKTSVFTLDGVLSLFHILSDKTIFRYVMKNFAYDLPIIGKRLFIKNVRKIIPSIRLDQIKYGRRLGGIRPQVVNTKTQQMELGEAKILADNIIFDITPSPGASVCLSNAEKNARIIVEKLGAQLDEEKFKRELLS